jgi:3-phosphoshikimate 1-carboxyvinyltransferase
MTAEQGSQPDSIEIQPIDRPLSAMVRPPGSKSITNRALVCAALAHGQSTLTGALDSEDTQVMIAALRSLAIGIHTDDSRSTISIAGTGGTIPAQRAELYIANSGTTVRFLTAMLALGHGTYRLDGTPRMRERPIQHLMDALSQLGVRIRSESGTGCPPVTIEAAGLRGGTVRIQGDISSQFLSGLLIAAPYASVDLDIQLDGPLVSRPYVEMTLAVMRAFGVTVRATNDLSRFRIDAPHSYQARIYPIEPDASAASYFWAAAAICGGSVTVAGLSRDSLQGDVAICECLQQMGCSVEYGPARTTVIGGPLRGIDVDMNGISDTVQTLGAVALFAKGTTHIHGVAHIRHKETDRIAALATELRKLGAHVDEREDGLSITPAALHGASIDTYNDHRMAMSLALVGLKIPGVRIKDPGCTAKTYPNYFADLDRLRQQVV